MTSDYQLELLKKEKKGPDVTTFYFKKPKNFHYKPGQYVKVTIPLDVDDSKGGTRFFTLSSSPTEDCLFITTKMQPSQFKKQLYRLQKGELLHVRGPYGIFTFNTSDTRRRVCIAGGMGITPFRSMVRFADDVHLTTPMTVFYVFRTIEQAIFLDELTKIARKNTFLSLHTLVSSERGHFTRQMIVESLENLMNSVYYICGPTEMVDDMLGILKTLNIPEDKIQKEYFSGYTYE